MSTHIDELIHEARQLLSRCAEQLTNFDIEIVQILNLRSSADYNSVIDCFYTFEDTQLAKDCVRKNGLGTIEDQNNFGLVYLKFYGLMNACYLQQQAVIVCARKLGINTDLKRISSSPMMQYRNAFAAHSPNQRAKGHPEHSYILDRFGLLEGRISGYTDNGPTGFASKDAKLLDLLNEWDECLTEVLKPICLYIVQHISQTDRIRLE